MFYVRPIIQNTNNNLYFIIIHGEPGLCFWGCFVFQKLMQKGSGKGSISISVYKADY